MTDDKPMEEAAPAPAPEDAPPQAAAEPKPDAEAAPAEEAPPPAAAAAEGEGSPPPKAKAERKRKQPEKPAEKPKAAEPASPAEGGRQRKQVQFFQVEIKEKEEFVVKPGKGTKLGEIPNVHYHMGKLKTDDELLHALHNLLYKRPGTANRRKKNLFEFSGFAFDKDEQEKEKTKVEERLGVWTVALLNSALDVFELPRGTGEQGNKESKIERLMKFLEKPEKLGSKDLAAEEAKKKAKAAAKREKATKKAAKKSPAAKKGKAAKSPGKKSKKDDSDDEEEEDEEEEPEEEEEQPKKKAKKEKEEKPKKEAKKEKEEKPKKEKKEKEAKEEKPKKEKKEKPKKEKKPKEDDDDDDDAPLGAVASGVKMPTDEELKAAVLKTLKGVDVNAMTMKQLMAQLGSDFKLDLGAKKGFIKDVAVEFAKSQQGGDEAPPAADAAA